MKYLPVRVSKLLSFEQKSSKSLISEAKRLAQIKILINQCIDYQIAEHIHISTIRQGKLIMYADSAIWATRLRYLQPQILNQLSRTTMGKHIRGFTIKVRPTSVEPRRTRRRLAISTQSAKKMLSEADAISDPDLRASLQRIARHGS